MSTMLWILHNAFTSLDLEVKTLLETGESVCGFPQEDASGCGWLIEKESKKSLLRRSGGEVEPAELTHSPCYGV